MTQYAYSPDTGEYILTGAPAAWMGTTDVAPPAFDSASAGCFWRGTAWEIVNAPIVADAKTKQIQMVTSGCGAAIVTGFQSSALGAVHTYPSQPFDQTNLIGAVASGLATIDFWCMDSTGAWSYAPHTAAQIKQVLADGGTQRMAYSSKLGNLISQINAATTEAQVQAVVW